MKWLDSCQNFKETLNKVELQVNHVWINRAQPVYVKFVNIMHINIILF